MTAKVDPSPSLVQQLRAVCQALDDKKAEHLTVLHLGEESSLTEYFIIATGVANSHLRALRITVEGALDKLQVTVLGSESSPASGWVVVDAVDFMVHLFLREVRDIYRLEQLWRDAKDVTAQILAPEPEPVPEKLPKKQPSVRKITAKKTPTIRKSRAKTRPSGESPWPLPVAATEPGHSPSVEDAGPKPPAEN